MTAPAWVRQPTKIKGPVRVDDAAQSSPSQVAQPTNLPKGILPVEFSLANVSGTVTDSQLYRILGASATVISAQLSFTVPFKGSIVAMSVAASENKTAGTATFKAFREGVDTTAKLLWATGTNSGYQVFQPGQFTFAAGDSLDVRVTTSSFTPTTADVEVFIYLAQEVT